MPLPRFVSRFTLLAALVAAVPMGSGAVHADSITPPARGAIETRACEEGASPPSSGQTAVKGPSLATVDLYAAASASSDGITFEGYITVLSIAAQCDGKFVDFSAVRYANSPPAMGDEPAVAVVRDRFCMNVSDTSDLARLVGRRAIVQPVALREFLNGEEYSSPDPADLQAAGVSLYLPDDRFGHQLAVFILAGYLETPNGLLRQANAAVAAVITSGGRDLSEQRQLLSLRSPSGTPVNVMGRAPRAVLQGR